MKDALIIITIFSISFTVVYSVCPSGWARRGFKCYYIFQEKQNRSDAGNLCEAHSSNLISFADQGEWDYVTSLAKASNLDTGFWTGLVLVKGQWQWEDSTPYNELYHWQTPNQPGVNYMAYLPTPTDTMMYGKMINKGSDVTYMQLEANFTQLYPYCKRDIDARDLCDTSENWVRLHAQCYKLYPPSTWKEAVTICQASSGRLLAPTKDDDLTSVTSLLSANVSIWVDATDTQTLGIFYTSRNDMVSYLPWIKDQQGGGYALNPNKTCAVATFNNSDFGYQTQSCSQELPFVCSLTPGTCPLGWIQDGIDCYQLHIRPEEKLTWSVAVDHCSRQGALMIFSITDQAKTILNRELQDNDINLIWVGISGTGSDFRYITNDVVRGRIFEYDTTDVTGSNSRCGVTDLAPYRDQNLAVYCYTPRNFICTASLTTNINAIQPPYIRCEQGWTIYNDYCVQIGFNSSNFTDAQHACEKQNASLFIINNDIDQSLFSTPMFLSEGIAYYWIGVTYDVNQAAYTLVKSSNPPTILNFDPDQRYGPSQGSCIFVKSGSLAPFIGSWVRDICSSKHKFVCQKAGVQIVLPPTTTLTSWSPQCSVGWLYSSDSNECYLINAYDRKTWLDARAECIFHNGHLLSISGEQEQSYLEKLLKSSDYNHLEQPLWIGARDVWNGHGWGWSDNKPFQYIHWGQAQPDYDVEDGNNCGYMPVAKSFQWESRQCTEKLGSICKKKSINQPSGEFPTQAPFQSCMPEPLVSGQRSLQFASSFSASSYLDDQHRPENCRLLDDNNATWSPAKDRTDEWLAIHFHSPATISDLLLKGEDSTDKYVTKFKLQYQYNDDSQWTWVVEDDRSIKVFDGVTSPDSSTSIFMIGDLQAQALKIWPVEWSYGIAIQIEINGCLEDVCQPEFAMSGPFIVSDQQIMASSSKPDKLPWNARLRPVKESQQLSYWVPADNDTTPWIQVDLGKIKIIRGITLSGDMTVNNYVSKFQLQFSQTDQVSGFINYTEPYGVPKIFDGLNDNQQQPETIFLQSSVEARIVRMVILEKHYYAALKFDVLVCSKGCQPDPVMANRTNYQLTALDSKPPYLPDRSRLNIQKDGVLSDGWKPSQDTSGDKSYIMVDIGTIMLITTVATQGSTAEQSWVRSYYLAFSTDGKSFTRYGGNVTTFVNLQEQVVYNTSVLFSANFDGSTVVKNELTPPVQARYLQLWPHEFHSSITLRWEVYVCPVADDTPIGCYTDEAADPDLPYVPVQDSFASISPTSCQAHCYRQGFHYAGVENGTKCSCGNTYGMYGPSDDCSVLCSVPYADSVCGGASSNLIYNTGLGLSSLVCPEGWMAYRDHCYQLFVFNMSWFDAISACGNMSSHLVDISDHAENLFVTSLLGKKVDKSWIGLNDYRKSLSFEWSSQKIVTFTSWGLHQPAVNSGHFAHSVFLYQDGSWQVHSSDSFLPFICESNKVQSSEPVNTRQDIGCPQGWIAYNNKCIQMNRLMNSWHGAKSLCELDGSTLLHIDSSQENDFVASLLTSCDGQYWLDILDMNSSGLYQHFSGTADILTTFWATGKPDASGQCVSVSSCYLAGSWSNDPCDTKHRFLCQKPRNVTGSSTTQQSMTSSQPPTTPTQTSQCTPGWVDAGDHLCYQLNLNTSSPLLSWHEASVDCKTKGANLASFHSPSALSAVLQQLGKSQADSYNVWIGLNRFDPYSGFTWIDGSTVNFMTWASGQPQKNVDYLCGEILTVSGKMGFQLCSQLRGWVCSLAKGRSALVVPTVSFPQPDGQCSNGSEIWVKFKDHCYYLSDGQGGADHFLTWRESRNWCGMRNADLASINSQDENLFLQGLLVVYGIPARSVWIGLNQLDRTSGYSWSDGSPLGKWGFNWNINEPNDENGFEACGELLVRNGKWNDQNCGKRQGFICKRLAAGANSSEQVPPQYLDGNCPDQFVKYGQKCFKVMGLGRGSTGLSWSDAYTSCRNIRVNDISNYTVDLASISSELENAFVTTLLANDKRSAWIGLSRHRGGQLYWTNNEDLNFENWNRGEPDIADDGCVVIDGSSSSAGKWSDESCDQLLAYVCQGYTDPRISPTIVPPYSKCDGLQGFQRLGQSCVKLVDTLATWPQAQQGCKSIGANLVSVMDAFDREGLMLLLMNVTGVLWTGLNDIQMPGTYVWDSGYPVVYTNWEKHCPSQHSNGACVAINKSGYLLNLNCTSTLSYICRIDESPPQLVPVKMGGYCADQDFTLIGGACYLLVNNQTVSYSAALSQCKRRNANLASLHSSNHNLNLSGFQNIWIGLRDELRAGYSWEDGSPADYTHWAAGQPDWSGWDEADEGCVTMSITGEWTNRHCADQFGYLCVTSRSFDAAHPEIPTPNILPGSPSTTYMTSNTLSSSTFMTPTASSLSTPSSQTTVMAGAITQASGGDSGLQSGDIAGIVIGVILGIIVILVVACVVVRRNNLLKSSFLRQEARKAKNFENSLYEATHKDKFDDDIDAVSILGLDSRSHHISVSYTTKDRTQSVKSIIVAADKPDVSVPYKNLNSEINLV